MKGSPKKKNISTLEANFFFFFYHNELDQMKQQVILTKNIIDLVALKMIL